MANKLVLIILVVNILHTNGAGVICNLPDELHLADVLLSFQGWDLRQCLLPKWLVLLVEHRYLLTPIVLPPTLKLIALGNVSLYLKVRV